MDNFVTIKNEILVSANNNGLLDYNPNMIINTNYIINMKEIESNNRKCYDIVMLKGMPIRVCDENSLKKIKKLFNLDTT